MRSSLTSVSRFLSLISVALLACTGCDDEVTCGPGDAPDEGIVADSADVTITYGGLEYGQNNDCPADPNIISLTIAGEQVGNPLGRFTLCVGRPDQLAGRALALGVDDPASAVRVIDVGGDVAGCTYNFDDTAAPPATARTEGLCDAGGSLEGFALILDGTVTLERDCGGVVDSIEVALTGRVAVLPQP
jgi:hypothetical protein